MSNILLIGPIGTGKSTLAGILSKKLNMPTKSLDDLRWDYYREIGYSRDVETEIRQHFGFEGVYKYWKKFEAHSVVRMMEDYQNYVIDFGAGHSVYEDPALFSIVEKALRDVKDIYLILPSSDKEESIQILNEREHHTINRHFVEHESNIKLAKQVIYTLGKTPDETADDIIASLSDR